jgi:hypothetical protein
VVPKKNRSAEAELLSVGGIGQMHLEAAHVLSRCRVERAAEELGEGLDVADIVVAGLLAEFTHRHIFDHAAAKVTDGLVAHRGLLS